jgi:hypothetical protein
MQAATSIKDTTKGGKKRATLEWVMVISGDGFKTPMEQKAISLKFAQNSDMGRIAASFRPSRIQRQTALGRDRYLFQAVFRDSLEQREIKDQIRYLQMLFVLRAVQKHIDRVDPQG